MRKQLKFLCFVLKDKVLSILKQCAMAIQCHPMSLISVPTESTCATSY